MRWRIGTERETYENREWGWIEERYLPGIELLLIDWWKMVLSCAMEEQVGDREDLVASHNKCSSGGLQAPLE